MHEHLNTLSPLASPRTYCRILPQYQVQVLHSAQREPASTPAYRSCCHAPSLNPNTRLWLQASVPRGLAPKPARLGMPLTHCGSLSTAYGVMVPFGATQISELEITSCSPRQAPASEPLLNTNPDSHEPPLSCPPLSPPGSPPQHWPIGPVFPKDPNPSLGFQSSIPRGLASMLPGLRTPERNCRNSTSTRDETLQFGAAEPSEGEKPSSPRKATPTIGSTPGHEAGFCQATGHMSSTQPRGEPISAPADWACHDPRP